MSVKRAAAKSDAPPLLVVEQGPNQALIDYIEDMLKNAKSGELQGMAHVLEWKDGCVGEGWCVSGRQRYRMLGAAAVLMHKLADME